MIYTRCTQMTLKVMVFRRSSRNNLRPINRIKHVIDKQGGLVIGASTDVILIDTTDTPTLAVDSSVETGSRVNGIFLKVEVNATTSAALANCYMMVYKNPGSNLTFPDPNVIGTSDVKKYVFHQEMVMFQQQDGSNPRTLFAGVIPIPGLYRRNGPDDTIRVRLFSPGVTCNFCVQCHYKEFR